MMAVVTAPTVDPFDPIEQVGVGRPRRTPTGAPPVLAD